MAFPSIPRATYRLQFNEHFTFQRARDLVPYLASLGISHIYASPIFKAAPGSPHGYDICDHNQLNPEIGSREDFEALSADLKAHGLELILDFVPNHMGIGERHNLWWMDVLENGPSSPFASYFDVDWHPVKRELANKVLLPILGDQYGRVLERGELKVVFEEGLFCLHYFETVLPIEAASTRPILLRALELTGDHLPQDSRLELESIATALDHLPSRTDSHPERITERSREQQVIKRRLRVLCETEPQVRAAVEEGVARMQVPGDEAGFTALDELLNNQNYRLSYWRVASEEINYRRFFDINTLAAIRVERPEVFDAVHRLLFELLAEGSASGVRIDHIDGLYDPREYLRKLQEEYGRKLHLPEGENGLFLLVEKILEGDERLPPDWPVNGTTGYEFANHLIDVLVAPGAQRSMVEAYQRFTESTQRFSDIAYKSKLLVMQAAMSSEVNLLGSMLNRLSETNRWYRDFTLNALTAAIRETIACFPVYRTYLGADDAVSEEDRRVIRRALDGARRRNPAIERSVFDFLGEALLPTPGNPHALPEAARRRFAMKFQQCSGPITAKGVEDTAFYIYNRLIALNEVGGDPEVFGLSVHAFHQKQIQRMEMLPHCMLATSTHDTKRSEDVRARIAVLSEVSQEWSQIARRWHTANRKHKILVGGEEAPDRNEEYLLYQTLVGSWPMEPMDEAAYAVYVARIQAYMEKAVREAKVNSSWIEPNEEWDNAVRAFVAAILEPGERNRFLHSFIPFAAHASEYGAINALSQVLIKATSPGVPDFYQGCEMWDLSLVDPDNRRPVDFTRRIEVLAQLEHEANPEELMANWRDGRIKLFLTHRILAFRKANADLFEKGSYASLHIHGEFHTHCLAFTRSLPGQSIAVIAPRLSAAIGFPPLGERWGETSLIRQSPSRDLFTGREYPAGLLRLSHVLRDLPFAVLVSDSVS